MSLDLKWMTDDAERRAFIAGHAASILVSPDMPLRANLSVLDNIALIPQYRMPAPKPSGSAAWPRSLTGCYAQSLRVLRASSTRPLLFNT